MKKSNASGYISIVTLTLILLLSSTMIQSVDLLTPQRTDSHDGYFQKVQIAYIDRDPSILLRTRTFQTMDFQEMGL